MSTFRQNAWTDWSEYAKLNLMKRSVNAGKLDGYIDKYGMADLMNETGLSFYTIDRMRRGKYISGPSKSTRIALCSATKFKEDELFPLVGAKGKAS